MLLHATDESFLKCTIFMHNIYVVLYLYLRIFIITRFDISFRHSDSKNAMKDDKGFATTDSDIGDVYPLQLRLSVQRETKSFEVRISKKVYVLYSLKE
jgi:hypothetical protein